MSIQYNTQYSNLINDVRLFYLSIHFPFPYIYFIYIQYDGLSDIRHLIDISVNYN